jgi:replicative DNA helicase
MEEIFLSDVSSERAVLAGICSYGSDCFVDVADILNEKSFSLDINQKFYRCLSHILKDNPGAKIDIAALDVAAHDLNIQDIFEDRTNDKYTGNRTHVRSIMNFPIHKDNVRRLAARVRKLEIARGLTNQLDQAKSNLLNITGDETIDHILGVAENTVFDFTSSLATAGNDGPQPIGGGIRAYAEYLIDNPVNNVGISTGYPMYDKAIGGGLRRKTVNLIGARPKTGKTMFADNVAINVAGKQNIHVLNLDTEMSKEDHWNRMIANLAEVPINEIETGKFSENIHKKRKVFQAIDFLEKMPYDYVSIAGQPWEETKAMMRRWVIKNVGMEDSGQAKPCLIIYDYLKLMSSDGLSKNLQEYQLLGFQMTDLHNFMVRYGVPCLAFIQLNRDGINREDTDVASGSDRLIWLCSNFSIYKKKTDEEVVSEPGAGNRKLVPIACRHGAGLDDGDFINMNMVGQFARIVEGKTKNDLFKENKNKGRLEHDISKEEEFDFGK